MVVTASETRSDSPTVTDDKCLAFVIPVRHPDGKKVNDYGIIEALLEKTVMSLLNQTHQNVAVIVVCHQVPDWAEQIDNRVRFLDVTDDELFGPDQHPTFVDKGLRYTIGSLYAMSVFSPNLIMLMDADDYVHVELADRLLSTHTGTEDFDGYMINQGVHLGVDVDSSRTIRYQFAVVVREFDFTCGSCRVFDTARLQSSLLKIHPQVVDRMTAWPEPDDRGRLAVPKNQMRWLLDVTKETRHLEEEIIHTVGRHVKQKRHFKFRYVDFVAAAKGCGHGNHNGPRKGATHWYRVVRRMKLKECLSTFGLPPQGWSFDWLAMIQAKEADKRAGNVWEDG